MSNFGEIVEPVSRNAWEDWDEISSNSSLQLTWKNNINPPKDIKKFYLFEGKYLSDCVKAQNQLELINSIPEVSLQLYKALDKYICTIKDYNLVLSSEIVELLKPWLSGSAEVISIQTKSLPEYQTTDVASHDCIIRTVATTKQTSTDLKFPKLEQPNMISGVTAGVISLREHMDKSAVALVCYIESPEEYQIEELQQLLEKLSVLQILTSNSSSLLKSNLYI